jgi:hypothetical protein
MRLSEVRGRSTNQQRQSESSEQRSFNDQLGVIRSSAAFPKPIDAVYQGQPVRLIASGDIVGMSPALQVVDEQGKIDWVSADDVTVTQRRFLPATQRAQVRQKLNQTIRQATHN